MADQHHQVPPHLPVDEDDEDEGQVPGAPPAPAFPNIPAHITPELLNALANFYAVFQPPAPAVAPAIPAPVVMRSKVKDPDVFDGSDASKLRGWFTQLNIIFRARPAEFTTADRRINFAISYLGGTAQQWFQPYLEQPGALLPVFMVSWPDFVEELKVNFGEVDPELAAIAKLEALRMKDDHRVSRLDVQFNLYATLTGFNETALHNLYYKALPYRIKTQLATIGKPKTLAGLRTTVKTLDNQYWEFKGEESRARHSNPAPTTSSSSSKTSFPATSSSYSSSNRAASAQPSSRPKSTTPGASSAGKSDKTKELDKILKDGKLGDEERARRTKEGLCMYCGIKGHLVDDCPNKKKSDDKGKAKARAALLSDIEDNDLIEETDEGDESDSSSKN